MALSTEIPRSFHLYVTHVDGEGHFLRISGQLDQQASLMIESLFDTARENLEKGVGAASPGSIHEGIICAAKYKDGTYYRAKVINMTNIATGLVGVHFIDFGNKDIISLSTIRFLDKYDPMFLQLRGQATDFYLSRVINPTGRWEEPMLMKLQSLLCYSEYPVTLDVHTQTLPLISIQFKGNDLSTHLVSIRFGMALPIAKQEVLLLQVSESQHTPNWQPNFLNEAPAFSEHVPFLLNQNYPTNPASAMRMQQNVVLPFNGSIPATQSLMSKRLLNNKVSRTSVNLKAPARQPQHGAGAAGLVLSAPPPAPMTPPFPAAKLASPKKSTTYKSKLLEVNSQHKVFVSYAEEGPELFAVQLVSEATKLQDMMDDINRRPHSSLTEPPMIGTVCLGRMSGDRIICRAIVMNLSGSQCKLFFVDFGDTEMISYYDIFDIPEEYVKPNVFAMRFCLSGVKKLEKGPYLNEAFKQVASGKVLTLKVVAPEGPPLIQYGELYLDDKNILELLVANMKDKLQFKGLGMLPAGARRSVLVSYVDSCVKFYVQPSDTIEELNAVMEAVRLHCEGGAPPGELPAGAACCARFPDDGKWYRARVRSAAAGRALVAYVDYGNEQEVAAADLRSITPDLMRLPAVAMKCALKGFENRPVESKTSNQLEMLALEKTLQCQVVGALAGDTMLVTLVDDAAAPPLDVARKMAQLSQPRASHEVKARREGGEAGPGAGAGGSPEGSEEGRRRARAQEDAQPRDKESGFERGAGRHAPGDRPGARADRADRPDRRSASGRPWEGGGAPAPAPAPAPAADDWEEAPAPAAPPARHARDNRDRRKPREEERGGAGYRKEPGAGAGAGTERRARGPPASVQDRLRRDRYHQPEEREERRSDDWGNRSGGGRPDRRDNRDDNRGNHRGDNRSDIRSDNRGDNRDDNRGNHRGDNRSDIRSDNRGERRDNWEERGPRRELKERGGGRGGRGGRGGHAGPRPPRAERSFDDSRSERSAGSGGAGGRAPRSLEQPVPPETEFGAPSVEAGAQHEVAVAWIVSPDEFYTQLLALQPEFVRMMHSIPELYRGVRPYGGALAAGASVLARYPADGVLYRASVLSTEPLVVRYVDFGNKQAVEARDVWQLDARLTALPRMAVPCALAGVAPPTGGWRAGPALDRCFSAPRYQCAVHELLPPPAEERYRVSLWSDGRSVADELLELELAAPLDHPAAATVKDEPIDLSVLAGQRLVARVTHVADGARFSAQLDLDKVARLEETIAAYDVSKLVAPAPELVAAGTHCTLRRAGGVRRAVLRGVDAARGSVTALLPDYGEEVTAPVDDVLILPPELSVYYYQALQCELRSKAEDADELRARLLGNKFILHVHELDGDTLVTSLHSLESGREVAGAGAGEEGARVSPLCARAVFGGSFGHAYVSHARALHELYLQRSADADRLADLLERLYAHYEEGSPEPLAECSPGALCAAKSSDGNWYRAVVEAAEGERATVLFADYGNSEELERRALRPLRPRFHEPCRLALRAGLGLRPCGPDGDALRALRAWVADTELQVTLQRGSGGWLAGLHLDGADLAARLVAEGRAAPAEPGPGAPPGCVQMYVSHIDTPGQFWLQPLERAEELERLQAELQADAAGYPELAARELGARCAAKYLADELWYRAEVLDADADITTVRFLDYGNTDVVDARPGLLRALPERLRLAAPLAERAALNAVPAGTGEWSERAADLFAELLGDPAAPAHVRVVLRDATTYVDVFAGGAGVAERLVAAGAASGAAPAPAGGARPACYASHVNSPAEFWVQLEAAAPELQAVEAAMERAHELPELAERAEGALCAARYPEDGLWYRAQVLADGSEGTEVLFTDYGNACMASELRALPDELRLAPALSRKCALQKPRHVKAWPRRCEERFAELAAEGATVFTVHFVAAGDISIVDLFLDGESVTERLVALCEERPEPEPAPAPLDARLCHVHSPEELYVHALHELAELERVAEALAGAAELEAPDELRAGAPCAAYWAEHERWCRARALEPCAAGWRVHFLDYGTRAECGELRRLPAGLQALPALARACALRAAPAAARALLERLALEEAPLRVHYLDAAAEPALVRLLLDGADVLDALDALDAPASRESDRPLAERPREETETNAETLHKHVEEGAAEEHKTNEETLHKHEEEAALEETETDAETLHKHEEEAALEETETDAETLHKHEEEAALEETETDAETLHKHEEEAALEETETDAENLHKHEEEAALEETETNAETLHKHEEAPEKMEERAVEVAESAGSGGDEPAHAHGEDREEEFGDAEDGSDKERLDCSQADLDGSMDSTHTVIENKSFEAADDEGINSGSPCTPERCEDAPGSPGRDSACTDTGYTSGGDRDKPSHPDELVHPSERSPEKRTVERDNTAVEGDKTAVEKDNAAVEGDNTAVKGDNTVVERDNTEIEMDKTSVKGDNSTVKGDNSTVKDDNSAVKGDNSAVEKDNAAVEGDSTADKSTEGVQVATKPSLLENVSDVESRKETDKETDKHDGRTEVAADDTN